jgi:hypothetical protein
VTQAAIAYRHNEKPRRGLALAGALFCVKAILLIPHLIIIGVLQYLAYAVAYVGFWIVAITGKFPNGLQSLIHMYLRWGVRAYGWLTGITDDYPPFESDPKGYPIDAVLPTNEAPSRGWAVAGIFLFPKGICLIPHLFLLWFVMFAAVVATWFGYVIAFISGSLPKGIQDFVAGAMQWYTRLTAWFMGLTDEYPPFGVAITPAA